MYISRHGRAKPKCTCQLRPPTKSFANTVSPPDAWQGKTHSDRIELIGWNLVVTNQWDFNQCFSAVISFKDGGLGCWLPPRVNQPRCPSRSQRPPCSLFWPCKVTKMTRRGWGNIGDLRKCLLSVFTGWELHSAPPCGDVNHRPHVLILQGLSQSRHLYGFTFSIISSFFFIDVFSTTSIGINQFDLKNSFHDHMMKPKYSQNH